MIEKRDLELHQKIKTLERENAALKAKLAVLELKSDKSQNSHPVNPADQTVREPDDHLRIMLERIGDGIFLIDRESQKVTFANQTICNMLGFTMDEVIGMNIQSAHPGEVWPLVDRHLQQSKMGKVDLLANIPLQRRGGSVFFADIQVTCLTIAGVDYLMADFRDVTERRRAEEALQHYAKEQATLYAVSSAASAFLDPDNLLKTILDLVLNLPGIGADFGWAILLEDWPQNMPRLVAAKGAQEPVLQDQLMAWRHHCQICAPFFENKDPSPDTIPTLPCQSPVSKCPGSLGLKSHIAFPIRVSKRTLGIILLAWHKPIPFTSEDYALLMAIGRQVGLALRNAQLYQAAAQSNRLQVLNALSTAASSSLEMDFVLGQVLEMTCSSVRAASGAILQVDTSNGGLIFSQTFGERSEALHGRRLPAGKGIANWVAENRQIAFVNDVRQDERWYPAFDEKTKFLTRSVLCAPLLYRGEMTGVIEVLNKQGDFTQEDVSLLESVAAITSVAMENTRLFTATRTRAKELETLIQIGLTLTASLDFKGVVQNALLQVQQLFQASGVSLLQINEMMPGKVFLHTLLDEKSVEIAIDMPPVGDRTIEWAVSNQEAVLIKNASIDPLFMERTSELLFGAPPGSIMVGPMRTSNKTIGVLLVSSSQVAYFTDAHLHTLQAIAATLAIALENARLYQDLKNLLREREMTQANIVQTEKMAALGRLAASIAHEINNPLQAIQGCLTLFSEEMNSDKRKEKLEHYLNIVQSEIERISAIVSRTREYYRPERKGMQSIDLHTSLGSVLELTFKQLQQNNIIIERHWAGRPILLQANQDRLKQAFLNLILNAMDAMPGGGTLTITTHLDRIERKNGLPTPAVQIEFKDTGIGMAPEVQAKIFEPFFTTKEYGSGLGLSIVYGIVQALQGEVRVASSPGMGTTFSLLLPLEQV